MKRSIAPLALLLVSLVLVPASASAAVMCVPSLAPGCDDSRPLIQSAVNDAAPGDTVRIAAATYPEAVQVGKPLTLVGAGSGTLESPAGATVIAPPSGSALTLIGGGIAVRSMRLQGGSGGTFGGTGASVHDAGSGTPASASLAHVVAIGGSGDYGGQGVSAFPLTPGTGDLSIVDSELKAGPGGTFEGSALRSGIPTTITRSRLVGQTGGTSPMPALSMDGASGTVSRTTIEGGVAAATSLTPGGATSLTVSDSLITSNAANIVGVLARSDFGGSVAVNLLGTTTVVGEGGYGAVAAMAPSPGGAATVDLRNSVARREGPAGPARADLIVDGGTVTAASSSFDSVTTGPNGGSVPAPGSGDNVTGDPLLSPSFAPLAGSPLIDRGDPGFLTAGALDLAGVSRLQDGDGDCAGRPDIGAFEHVVPPCAPPRPPDVPTQPAPPAPPVVDERPGLSRVSLSRNSFTARKPRTKGRKKGTVVRFTLSEAARVTLSIERRTSGRRVTLRGKRRCMARKRANAGLPVCPRYVKAGALRKAGKAGRNALRISGKLRGRTLTPGTYRAKLVAVDAGGLRSAVKTLRFRVLAP